MKKRKKLDIHAPASGDRLLTLREAAGVLGLSTRTVREYLQTWRDLIPVSVFPQKSHSRGAFSKSLVWTSQHSGRVKEAVRVTLHSGMTSTRDE